MKPYFAMGLFSLYVVAVSLVRLLAGRTPRLQAMQRLWGCKLGLFMHFLAQVALPLVVGIVFLGEGAASFDHTGNMVVFAPVHHRFALPYLYPRKTSDPPPSPMEVLANGEIALLLNTPAAVRQPMSGPPSVWTSEIPPP